MNIKNATIIATVHNVFTDLKLRHLGAELFVEAVTPPTLTTSMTGPSFLLFDMQRQFAVVLQAVPDRPYVLFSPIILAELNPDIELNPAATLRMGHGEIKEMSLLIAYWFLRAKAGLSKASVVHMLKTTYSDIAPVQWGNMAEPMTDMECFLRNLKVPIAT
jgi:hypothetical protein